MLKKLMYINLFGITFLALFNYLVFHNLNSKAYLESFTAYNQRITALAFQNIDNQIMNATVEIPQLYFFNIIRENKILLAPQEERVVGSPTQVRGLVDQMQEIRQAYPYVANIDIYYEGTQTIFTGFSTVHEIKREEEVGKYLPWYDKYLDVGRSDTFLESPQKIYPTGEQVITYVKKISQSKWGDAGILVAIHISMDSFEEFIDEVTGSLVIMSHTGNLLYESPDADIQTTQGVIDGLYNEIAERNEDITQTTMKVNGEDMTVFHSGFQSTNLEYVYYVQNNTFYADYNIRNRIFLMNFLLSILYNLVVLAVFSVYNHYLYKKQVEQATIEAGIDVKREMSFGNSLQVLTQEINTMQPMMLQNELRALILNRRLQGGYERLERFMADYEQVCTIILYNQSSGGFCNTTIDLQQKFMDEKQEYQILFITMEREEMVGVFLGVKENFQQNFTRFLDKIQELEPERRIVTGAVCQLTKENVKNSYHSASEIGRYRFVFPDHSLLTWQEVDVGHRKSSGSHMKLFEAMEKDINSENFLDFKYHMTAFRVSFEEGHYTIDYCLSTVRDLVSLLYRIMTQRQLDMWIVFGYDIREYYKQIENIEEFEIWAVDICEVLLQNLRQRRRSIDTDLQDRLMLLIETNLENDISLDFLSDQLSMRPDVLSRLFKQMMGKGYTEYIKEKKMARALELMQEDYSIGEIASRLGYNSTQYFIKVFKEVYGTTPYQYKKQRINDTKE